MLNTYDVAYIAYVDGIVITYSLHFDSEPIVQAVWLVP